MAGPMEQTEAAAADRAIRFLLDGLEVESIRELKELVDVARAARRLQEALHRDGLDLRAQESSDRHGELLLALGWGPWGEPPEGWEDATVLGLCPHGVDLDRDFCPRGCRV